MGPFVKTMLMRGAPPATYPPPAVFRKSNDRLRMDPIDLRPDTPKWLRYDSLDELFFALLNLNVSPEGQA